jgi:hypothetical protein
MYRRAGRRVDQARLVISDDLQVVAIPDADDVAPIRDDQNEDPGLSSFFLPTDFGLPPKGSRHVEGDVVNQEAYRSLAPLMLR